MPSELVQTMRPHFLIFALSCLASTVVSAETSPPLSTTGDLARACKINIQEMDNLEKHPTVSSWATFCMGYIAGAGDQGFGWNTCIPNSVNVDEAIRVFVKWADENPDKLHLPEITGLRLAMSAAFPCASH